MTAQLAYRAPVRYAFIGRHVSLSATPFSFQRAATKSSLFAFPPVVAAVIQRGMRPMGIERADGSLEK